MKRINLLVGTMAIAAFGFVSCSDDDDSGSTVKISGTYDLEEVNTQAATDFNNDGTKHINQMDESSCYDAGKIILNDDGTLKYTITKILVDESDGSAGCATSFDATGLWQAQSTNGNNTTILVSYTDQSGDDQALTLTKKGDELTFTDNNLLSEYPDRDSNGKAIYTSGSTTYVFEK